MHPTLLDAANRLDIPLLLIDGFGRRFINSEVAQIIRAQDGQSGEINAEPGDLISGSRPELVVPSAPHAQGAKPVTLDVFAPGKKVRLVGSTEAGRLGTLVDLVGETRLSNGLWAESAHIRLENGDLVNYPLANLEILV